MSNKPNLYSYVQFTEGMKFPDGIYNGLYNKEPSIIRINKGVPSFVQFINNSSIFEARGIMLSNVELLIPAQQLQTKNSTP